MNGTAAVVCAQLCTYACPIQGGGWEAHVAGLEVGHLPRGGGVLFDEYSVTPTFFSVSTRCLMCSMLLRVDLTSVVLFYSCTYALVPPPSNVNHRCSDEAAGAAHDSSRQGRRSAAVVVVEREDYPQ